MNFYWPGVYDWIGYLDTRTTWPGSALAGHGKKDKSAKPKRLVQGSEGLNNYIINYI